MKKIIHATLLVAGLISAIGMSAEAKEKVNITQALAGFAFLPIDYAAAAGYFADEGIEVQQIATRGGGPDLTALQRHRRSEDR